MLPPSVGSSAVIPVKSGVGVCTSSSSKLFTLLLKQSKSGEEESENKSTSSLQKYNEIKYSISSQRTTKYHGLNDKISSKTSVLHNRKQCPSKTFVPISSEYGKYSKTMCYSIYGSRKMSPKRDGNKWQQTSLPKTDDKYHWTSKVRAKGIHIISSEVSFLFFHCQIKKILQEADTWHNKMLQMGCMYRSKPK